METPENIVAGATAADVKSLTPEQLAVIAGEVAKALAPSMNESAEKAAEKTATRFAEAYKQTPPTKDIVKNGAVGKFATDELVSEFFRHKLFGTRYAEKASTRREEIERQLVERSVELIQKDMTTGSAGNGAELTAIEYSRNAIEKLENIVPIFSKLNVFTMNEKSVNLPKYIGKPTADWVGENSSISTSGVTTDEVVFTAKKLAVRSAPISSELLMMARTMFMADTLRFCQQAVLLKKQAAVAIGTNTSTVPQGIDDIDAGREVAQVGAALDVPDAINLISGVAPQYRVGAVFVMTDAAKAAWRKVRNDQGNPIFEDPMSPNSLARLYGYEVVELPDIAGSGTASSPANIYFGNLRMFYGWGTYGSQRIDQTSEADNNFSHDTVQVRLIEMADAKILLDEAMCFMSAAY